MKTKRDDIRAALESHTHAEVQEIYEGFFPPPSKEEMIARILAEGKAVPLDDLYHSLCDEFDEADMCDRIGQGK